MKSTGKFNQYDFAFDIQNRFGEIAARPPRDLTSLDCNTFGYIVALGETRPPDASRIYFKSEGETTYDPLNAHLFERWTDAVKWALDNCEISELEVSVPPRGLERPRYPRICSIRIYTEVTDL